MAPPIPIISDFIVSQMEKFIDAIEETECAKTWELLDDLFRNTLIRINGNRIEPDGADNGASRCSLPLPCAEGSEYGDQ